jgi:hypothetical protein
MAIAVLVSIPIVPEARYESICEYLFPSTQIKMPELQAFIYALIEGAVAILMESSVDKDANQINTFSCKDDIILSTTRHRWKRCTIQ